MSDHFPTKAEQDAFFIAWHAQQQLTAGSDYLTPVPVHALEMAAEVGDEPPSLLRALRSWLSAARCDLSRT